MSDDVLARLRDKPRDVLERILVNAGNSPGHAKSAETIAAIAVILDARIAACAGAPLAERIEIALREQPLSDTEADRLRDIHRQPGSTAAELADRAGHRGQGSHQAVIGRLCKRRQRFLPVPNHVRARDDVFWSGLLCDLVEDRTVGRYRWTLKPDTVEALRRCGYLSVPRP